MKIRWIAFPVIGIIVLSIYWLFLQIPTELVPTEDRSELRINMAGPEGATFGYMSSAVDKLTDQFMEEIPETERLAVISVTSPGFGTANTNSAFIRLFLTDANQRTRTQQEIFNSINTKLRNETSVRGFAQQPVSIGDRRGGLPVQYVIQAPTIEKLKEAIPPFMEEVGKSQSLFSQIST